MTLSRVERNVVHRSDPERPVRHRLQVVSEGLQRVASPAGDANGVVGQINQARRRVASWRNGNNSDVSLTAVSCPGFDARSLS